MRIRYLSCIALLLAASLYVVTFGGCLGGGGGGGGGSSIVYKSNSTIRGYVFVPVGTVQKRGAVQPKVVQAPPGMVPLVGATVKLSDGKITITDANGRYEFRIQVEEAAGEIKTVEVWVDEAGTTKVTYEVKVEIDKYTVSSAELADVDGDDKLDIKEIIIPPPTEVKPGTGGDDDPEEIIPIIIATTYEFAGVQEVTDLETGGEAQLTWTAPTLPSTLADDVPMAYCIFAAKASGEQDFVATPLSKITDGAVTATVSGLDNDTYYFAVRAKTASGKIEDEPNAVELSAAITDTTAPTFDGIEAVAFGDKQATVYWNTGTDNTGPVSYKIYSHTSSPATGGTAVTVSSPTASSGQYEYERTITALTNGTTYYFMVHALDSATTANEDDNTAEESTVPKGIPGAPAEVEASLSAGKIVISWDAPPDTGGDAIDSYKVYRGLTEGNVSLIASGLSDDTYDDDEDDDTPLTVDTEYFYKVSAVNSQGEGAQSSAVSETFRHVPGDPTNLAASVITTTGFTFSWDDVSGETGYRVYKDSEQYGTDLSADSVSMAISVLTAATAYSMEVSAFNDVGEGDKSSLDVETLPEVPTGVEVTDTGATGFTVTWEEVSGDAVDGYRVYLDNVQYGSDVTTGATLEVTGVASATTFSVQVSAYTGGEANVSGGEGNKSAPAVDVLTLPGAPDGLEADSVDTESFTLSWDQVDGEVDGYLVYVDGDEYDDTDSLSSEITELDAATAYSMQVSAYNDTGEGAKSSELQVTTVPEAPVNVITGNYLETSFAVNWDAVTGADGYRVYIDDVQDGSDLSSSTTHTATGKTGATTYSVEVAAFNAGGESEKSSPAVDVLTLPAVPTGLAADTITDGGFSVDWNSVNGEVDGYRVYLDSAQYGTDITTGTSVEITGLDSGTDYAVEVSAFNDTGESRQSSILDVATLPDIPENIVIDYLTIDGFIVNWDEVSGDAVDGYRVYLDDVQYGSDVTDGQFMVVTGRDPATTYSVEVSAYTDGGEGDTSDPVDVLTLPSAPTGLAADSVDTESFTLTWDEGDGEVDGYLVYLDGQEFDDTVDLTSDITGLASGMSYDMEVSAYNETGESALSSALDVATLPDAPENVSFDDFTADGFTVSWDEVGGNAVDGYRVYLDSAQYGGDVTGGLSLDVTGRISGTTYEVEVTAFSAGGEGDPSDPVEALTLPDAPTGVAASDILPAPDGGFTVDWIQVDGADGYRVYLDGEQHGDDVTPGSTTTLDATGLDYGFYLVTVNAFNDSGEGAESYPVVEVTVTGAATLSGSVSPSGATVQLWQGTTLVAEDEDGASGTYSFSENISSDDDLIEGSYTLRAYMVVSPTQGYLIEESVELDAGANTHDVTAVEFSLSTFNITVTDSNCTFYGTAALGGTDVKPGDYVTAQDPDGITCGLFIINTEGEYGLITVYGDEASTAQVDEGAEDDDTITFFINGSQATPSGTPTFTDGAPSQEVNLTVTSP